MQPTLIGIIQILVGFYLLLSRRVEAMLAFTMACTLMGGAASLSLSALGNASISPGHIAIAFLALRIVLHRQVGALIMPALRQNAAILIFALYGIVAAIALPRMFRNGMDVVPMKPIGLRNLYDTAPLVPTSQNVTTAVYMAGTAICALLVFVAVRQPRGATRFVKTAVVITWVHAILGILSSVGAGTGIQVVLSFFRNGNYAQVDQSINGYARINGIMPEASAYAGYGMFWCILMAELWLRDVMPRRTGLAALALSFVLVASTSSTAYIGLAFYLAVIILRTVFLPGSISSRKVITFTAVVFLLVVTGALFTLLYPQIASTIYALFEHFTVGKMEGDSGKQRSFWAYQGLNAFTYSYGLGIGPGSFRSSSIVTAIIGSVGIIGSTAFVLYCIKVLRPGSSSTYYVAHDPVDAVGISASWAAILSLVPLAATNPSPDPGLAFGVFAGVALGLRSLRQPKPNIGLRASPRFVSEQPAGG